MILYQPFYLIIDKNIFQYFATTNNSCPYFCFSGYQNKNVVLYIKL